MRWESQNISSDDEGRLPGMGETVVRRFDAPEALNMRFHEVRTKSALNHVPPGTSRVPFEWTINPYRGCTHACVYCFARPTHEYLELDAGRDFEREIIVKVNVPEVLRKELARPSWRGASIALGTNTDPYQWVEGRYKLMRGIWEAMRDFRNPCSILTKSPLLLRDLDLLQEIAAVTEVSACMSVPTLDEKAWRATEPHTPNPKARLDAVATLNAAGIPCGVLIAPLMPGVNDAPEQVEAIVDAATEANATYIGGQTLFLRGAVRDLYFDWLREHRPDLVGRYEKLYAKGAYVSQADKRKIELAAGAPWALRTYPSRFPHRGEATRRRAEQPPRAPRATQGSLF
jgi:DNA repair photolyase